MIELGGPKAIPVESGYYLEFCHIDGIVVGKSACNLLNIVYVVA